METRKRTVKLKNKHGKKQNMYCANGFKTSWFGSKFWTIYHHWSYATENPEFLRFFYLIPQHILPCIFCRQSYAGFVDIPGNEIEPYLCTRTLPEWVHMIHNYVNAKLEKPLAPYHVCARYRNLKEEEWTPAFWTFVFSIALNYPAHFNFKKTRVLDLPPAELERYKMYILFYDNLKNLIPASKLGTQWIKAYTRYPISSYACQSRAHLVQWLHNLASETGEWTENLEDTIRLFEQHRASSCSTATNTCA